MSECAAGGDHEFEIAEEDQHDNDRQTTRPTRCSKCNSVWDYWVYRWDGEYEYDDRGDPECAHEWETTDGSTSSGSDGAPWYVEVCSKCTAERREEWDLAENYHGDAEGNRV